MTGHRALPPSPSIMLMVQARFGSSMFTTEIVADLHFIKLHPIKKKLLGYMLDSTMAFLKERKTVYLSSD